jgi:uncharacterized protein (TIGR00725 family)
VRTHHRLHVAVIGPSDADEPTRARAEAAGAAVARHDAVLVCGGLGGVMEAACRGARTAGGTSIGILPGTDRAAANPFVDVAVPTGLGEARNALVVRCADAVVAIGGGYGTLSEIALALRDGKPVVGLDTWELRRDGRPIEAIVEAGSAEGAVELAVSLAAARHTP